MTSNARVSSEPGFLSATSLIQLGYGIWVNLTVVTIGLAFGFSAIAVPQLRSPESPIKISLADEAWITSVVTLMSPVGCVVCGYLVDKFGRRLMLVASLVPVCIGWLVTGFADNTRGIIIGRVITSIGFGMVSIVPRVYMTEISLPDMRGMIGAFPNIAISIGITVQAGLGSIIKWTVLCYINCMYALTMLFINFFLPETPYYVLCKSSVEQAKESLKRFRSNNHDIETETQDLIQYKLRNDLRRLSLKEQILMIMSPSCYKPFCMITIYMIFTQLSGCTIITMWTIELLEKSNSSVDPKIGNVILGLSRLFGGILASFLIFKVRRRSMALISAFGVGLVCVFLGIFLNSTKSFTVIPLTCFVAYFIFATMGYYTIPILTMYELYPLQVRGLLSGISISTLNILIFCVNKSYPYARDYFGFTYTIIAFGVSSLAGCIFIFIFLPETKGLTLQQTETYYKK